MKIILQKYIADSGCCSRRQAEELIRDKKVLVNGRLAELGMKVDNQDRVEIDRKIIKPEKNKIYIKLNKPIGYTCTNKSFKNEKNIFELLHKSSLRAERSNLVKSNLSGIASSQKLLTMTNSLSIVGRLDKNSRGLIILTNDGDWAQKMSHPKFEKEKEYLVKISKLQPAYRESRFPISNDEIKQIIKKFKNGIEIEDGDGMVRAKEINYLGDNEFKIILTQGKKRQIRRMFEKFGLEVNDLLRIRIGNINLGNLKEGEWKVLPRLKRH